MVPLQAATGLKEMTKPGLLDKLNPAVHRLIWDTFLALVFDIHSSEFYTALCPHHSQKMQLAALT